jgi:hypothetical protein
MIRVKRRAEYRLINTDQSELSRPKATPSSIDQTLERHETDADVSGIAADVNLAP